MWNGQLQDGAPCYSLMKVGFVSTGQMGDFVFGADKESEWKWTVSCKLTAEELAASWCGAE